MKKKKRREYLTSIRNRIRHGYLPLPTHGQTNNKRPIRLLRGRPTKRLPVISVVPQVHETRLSQQIRIRRLEVIHSLGFGIEMQVPLDRPVAPLPRFGQSGEHETV